MRLFLLFFALAFISASPLEAALSAPAAPVVTEADLSREAVEAKLGRKLKFTERVALSLVRKKAKKQAKRAARGKADGRVTDTMSLVSMILGILGLVLAVVTIYGGLLSVAALVLGIIGLSRIRRAPDLLKGKGFAIAGIVLGGAYVALVLLIVAILLTVFR